MHAPFFAFIICALFHINLFSFSIRRADNINTLYWFINHNSIECIPSNFIIILINWIDIRSVVS